MNDWQKEAIYQVKKYAYIDKAEKMIDAKIYQDFTVEELARFLFDKDYG